MDYFGLSYKRGMEPEVWEDERTGLLCRTSNLYGGVGVPKDHPWYNRKECPIDGYKSYGIVHYPKECEGRWWFYFPIYMEDYDHIKKRCMILAALLEVEGTELAQEIASLPLSPVKPSKKYPVKCVKQGVKREGGEDDGEDDHEDYLLEKIASTFKDYGKPNVDIRLIEEYLAACADEH